MKVFVYKEYNDDYAYGEELIKVYADKNRAKEELAERVIDWFRWEDKEYSFQEILDNTDDQWDPEEYTVMDDYVVLPNRRGGTVFFMIEEHEVV